MSLFKSKSKKPMPEKESDSKRKPSIAVAMSVRNQAKKKLDMPAMEEMMSPKGSVTDRIRKKRMAEGGEVDLSRNADEDLNLEDQLSFDAGREENYAESEGLEDLDYDTDKSMGHELSDEDEHAMDLISRLRAKMKKMR